MKIILIIARLYIPVWIKKQYLQQLFDLTAESFQKQAPQIKNLSYQQGLFQFAKYSKVQAESAIRFQHNVADIKSRLFDKAFQLGQRIRKRFRVNTNKEIIMLCQVIYRVLAIDFRANLQGEVRITNCFFSRFYSREVCELISAIDAGVLAGISGGRKISFQQRITEGKDCCRAYFNLKE